jgi:hypothetical protein
MLRAMVTTKPIAGPIRIIVKNCMQINHTGSGISELPRGNES